ncbi:MAG: recombinase family protein [Oscillospiraceae bacterium]|nr:recombinase family protein [Oscillospiraceae bacterium]
MIKVAGYCRVSTDKDDQANSFETQKTYFREYIQRNPDWELYEIYADEGITGTSTKKRKAFNRMMNDAYGGKFQLIVTKEVSRFSRNILDTISYTRELRAMGIGVIFATDRINTLEPESEMILSYIAAQSQEESRRTSTRVVWGQTRQMERGVVFGRSLLGYDVKGGKMAVNSEGAEIVRLIFQKYALEQVGTSEIARYLTDAGCRTCSGSSKWSSGTVIKILNNEKYVGDLVQKKTYTPDYLTHEKKANRGAVPLIMIPNHHEPIISREVWNLAQERLRRNNKHAEGERGCSNRYVFSGRIKCGQCGSSFVGRFKYRKDGTKIRRWSCGKATSQGRTACDVGKLLRDDDAMQMLKTAIRALPIDAEAVAHHVTQLALEAVLEASTGEEPDRLQQEMNRVQQKKEALLEAYFSREITKGDMLTMKDRYEQQLTGLQKRREDALKRKETGQDPEALRANLRREVLWILSGDRESQAFYKTLLQSLTVFKDRHTELRLHQLPLVFHFAE